MRGSIIIVTQNGLHHLEPCLESLLPQITAGWEIVVVDNGSTDGTVHYLKSLEASFVRHVLLETASGFAAANNKGLEHTSGDYLFLLNNDTVCAPGLLRVLEESVSRFREFNIFACRMMRMSDGRVDNMGVHFSRCLRGYQIGTGRVDACETPREVFGASGGAMLFHRAVAEDVGLFEPFFYAYQEDVDFAVRARLAGHRCLHIPQAVVYHRGEGTSSKNKSLFLYYNQRNMELILRNLPCWVVLKYGVFHFGYAVSQIAKWALRGRGWLVLRAKYDGLRLQLRRSESLATVRVRTKDFENFLRGRFELDREATIDSWQRVGESNVSEHSAGPP